jgi:hypothetical protein
MKMCLTFVIFALAVFVIAPAALRAQTSAAEQTTVAAELEEVLAAQTMSYGQAAAFVLRAADVQVSGTAFDYAVEKKWLTALAAEDGAAVLNEVSLLIMGAFGIRGGIMYTGFKSPRYAYRELVQQGIIQGRADPDMAVSGDLLLFMIGRVLDKIEEDNQ